MRRKLVPLVLILVLTSGCGGLRNFGLLTASRGDDDDELASPSGRYTAGDPQQLVELALNAERAAEKSRDAKKRVSFYRLAAVAAWQAGDAEGLVLRISQHGVAACEALPNKDKSAPDDCSIIRLAAPFATQDALARYLLIFQQKAGPTGETELPPADQVPLQKLFDGFEAQFAKVSAIRSGLSNLDISEDFKARTDRQRVIIYCNAVKAWSLSRDVDGAPVDSLTAMAKRKKQIAEQLDADAIPADCQTVSATQTLL